MLTGIKHRLKKMLDRRTALHKAIDWVKNHHIPGSGIVVHHKTKNVTQEVTGYLIESLYNAGEKELAFELAKWEASVQQPDGSFLAPDNIPYTFDTAQVVRGFLAVSDDLPEVEKNLKKACDFLLTQIDEKGEVHTPRYDTWKVEDGSQLSRYCNLFVLSPLKLAGRRLNNPKYIEAVNRAVKFYKAKPDIIEFKSELGTLSHIYGYMLEGLVDLGEVDLAKQGIKEALKIQKKDGAIPAYPGVDWVCSTGMAQLGIVCAKLRQSDSAERILKYLEKIQNPSGGFYGSYGKGGQYFAGKEISWANKFFIDLYLLVRGK